MKISSSLLVFILMLAASARSQTKQELLSGKWAFKGIEEFGVVKTPDSTHSGDYILFIADGTYSRRDGDKSTAGTWKFNETAKTIAFTDSMTKKQVTSYLKKLTDSLLIIEFQTPDLVRTRYRFEPAIE